MISLRGTFQPNALSTAWYVLVWTPKFDMKHLKKAEEHIGRNVVCIEKQMKSIVLNILYNYNSHLRDNTHEVSATGLTNHFLVPFVGLGNFLWIPSLILTVFNQPRMTSGYLAFTTFGFFNILKSGPGIEFTTARWSSAKIFNLTFFTKSTMCQIGKFRLDFWDLLTCLTYLILIFLSFSGVIGISYLLVLDSIDV